jgi:hypothetical protein
MPPTDALGDLELLIKSRYGLICLEGAGKERAFGLLRHLADSLRVPLFTWDQLHGLSRVGVDGSVYGTVDLAKALGHIASSRTRAIYQMHGLGEMEAGSAIAAILQEATATLESLHGAIVVSGSFTVPPELERRSATVSLPGPGPMEFGDLLSRIVRDISRRQRVEVDLSASERATLIKHLSGLTLMEAEKILTKAIIEDGRLAADDIHHVIDAKRAVVEREGLLEYYPAEDSVAGVADLETLKEWLAKRRAVITTPEKAAKFGLGFPRGVLLLGVPGCGKSLSAKAVAMEWNLPLLKLDPSNLYNKFIGESEQNFKRAMKAAERMAPVVLWIDELEKAFATGGDADAGVSQRILGSFLSWMQDRQGDVFIVATANDISKLPPEFLRKGRFDEIFFVDLPDGETRKEIFRIHLESREQDMAAFDLDLLAASTEGFSGAEIEQVVVSGLYTAFTADELLSNEILVSESQRTRPLAVTMAERVAHLREWARTRAVSAN